VSTSGQVSESTVELRRVLGPFALTMIGVGSTIGAGIFVMTGTVAAQWAGPAITLSFLFAALACLLTGLCYAELASMMPLAGSAYSYANAAMGRRVAWVIGWCLILEYLVASSVVAVGWSGYAGDAAQRLGLEFPASFSSAPFVLNEARQLVRSGSVVNLPAVSIVLTMSGLLVIGVRESTLANTLMVILKVGVILLVVLVGAFFVQPDNWKPFIPENRGETGAFGWSGVLRASAVIFYAYIGFETISTCAQEAKRPQRDLAIGILASLLICTVLYVAMGLVVTGLAHYTTLNVPDPIMVALDAGGPGLSWIKPLVSTGAIVGLASTILVTLYGQTRIFFTMAKDHALPAAFARVHPRFRTPSRGIWFAGIACAAIAGLFPLDLLGELVSIGTLLAFAVVCVAVIVLRVRAPDAPRPFRVPLSPVVPALGSLACFYLMFSLPADAWWRLLVWLAVGAVVYFFAQRRSGASGGELRQDG
jgi:APA family basic amino acid/polyamine antiporter